MPTRDMVARHSNYHETRDYIPTPPWATRALYEYVVPHMKEAAKDTVAWDPACGAGHMLKVFEEYGHAVVGSDIELVPSVYNDTNEAFVEDFLRPGMGHPPTNADYIITNPPYKHLGVFISKALSEAKLGVGMLVRVQALEGERRYEEIFSWRPPTQIAFFANRIPFKVGAVVQKAPKMFFHTWLWWEKDPQTGTTRAPRPPVWVPYNAQTRLEEVSDYED